MSYLSDPFVGLLMNIIHLLQPCSLCVKMVWWCIGLTRFKKSFRVGGPQSPFSISSPSFSSSSYFLSFSTQKSISIYGMVFKFLYIKKTNMKHKLSSVCGKTPLAQGPLSPKSLSVQRHIFRKAGPYARSSFCPRKQRWTCTQAWRNTAKQN